MLRGRKMQIILFFGIFVLMNLLIWVSTNGQLVKDANQGKAMLFCIVSAIPISLLAFYGTRIGYNHLGSAWSVRLAAFGISYMVFPFMTYFYLNESPFNLKTMICIALSFAIVCIQVFWPHN